MTDRGSSTGGGVVVALVAVAAVVTAVAAVTAFFMFRSDDGGQSAAPEWTTVAPAADSTAPSTASDTAVESTTHTDTVTVTAEGEASSDRAEGDGRRQGAGRGSEPAERSASGNGAGRGLQCDGRGVLIVASVMGDSPTFRSEVDGAIAANPGAVLLEPGYCPSLRASVDGTTVHPVVVDYGDDRAGLCGAAASTPGSNARLLNDDTSYSSPC